MCVQLTNLKHEVKAKLEADYKHGGQRSPAQVQVLDSGLTVSRQLPQTCVLVIQVLANSMGGTVFAVTAAFNAAGVQALQDIPTTALTGAFLV